MPNPWEFTPGESAVAERQVKTLLDQHPGIDRAGAELPPGAAVRIGGARLRHAGVQAVALSTDGGLLASAGHVVNLWDARRERLLWTAELDSARHEYRRVAFSRDDRLVLALSRDAILVWDLNGALIHRLSSDWTETRDLALSLDGRVAVVFAARKGAGPTEEDSAALVWDLATGALVGEFRCLEHVVDRQPQETFTCAAFQADGELIVGTALGPTPRQGRLVPFPPGSTVSEANPDILPSRTSRIALTPDDKTSLLVCGQVGSRGGKAGEVMIEPIGTHPLFGLAGDGALAVARHCRVSYYPADGATPTEPVRSPGKLLGLALSADGRIMVTADKDGLLRVYEGPDWKERAALAGVPRGAEAILLPDDLSQVVIASENGHLQAWGATTGVLKWSFYVSGYQTSFAFSPDGHRVAFSARCSWLGDGPDWAGDPDYDPRYTSDEWPHVRVVDLPTQRQLCDFALDRVAPSCLAWSPDGARLAVGDMGGGLTMSDPNNGQAVWTIGAHPRYQGGRNAVHGITFSGDGRVVASYTRGELPAIRLWRAADGKADTWLRQPFRGVRRNYGWMRPEPWEVVVAHDGETVAWVASHRRLNWCRRGEKNGHKAPPCEALRERPCLWLATLACTGDGQLVAAGEFSRGVLAGHRRSHWCKDPPEMEDPDSAIVVWDAVTGKVLWQTPGPATGVRRLAFSRHATNLVVANEDKTLVIWPWLK